MSGKALGLRVGRYGGKGRLRQKAYGALSWDITVPHTVRIRPFFPGSGLFSREGKQGMQEARRLPCVPCFIFPKVGWNVSNRSFLVLMVLPRGWQARRQRLHPRHQARSQWKDASDG